MTKKKHFMSNFQSNEFICNFTMIVRLKSGFSPGKKQQILFLLVKLLSLVDFDTQMTEGRECFGKCTW